MDKPQSFEEVFKDAYDYWIDDADIHRYEGAKGLADQVWQHQQAKVEELQKRVDDLEKHLKPCTCGSKFFVDLQGYVCMFCYRCGGKKSLEEFKEKFNVKCIHESDDSHLLSNPPKTKCKKCGEFYSAYELKDGGQ